MQSTKFWSNTMKDISQGVKRVLYSYKILFFQTFSKKSINSGKILNFPIFWAFFQKKNIQEEKK